MTVTPAANQSGTATITVSVSDGVASASDTFVLTVNAVNDAPTISDISDRTIARNGNTGPLAFTVGDVETAAGSLTVSGSSNDTTLVPNANIVFGGSGASRTVTVTPATGQTGTATITVTVSDGQLTASDTFVLTVVVNFTPTIGPLADQTAYVDQPVIIKLELSDVETPVTNLQLSLVTTNPSLFKPEDYEFHYFFVDGHRYLTMAGAFGQTGSGTNTVTVSDGVNSASTSFVMTVLPPPSGTVRFANTSPFTIPNVGAASPYPSVINVSGMTGGITKLELTVSRFGHEFTNDVNMLLVGPTGVGVVFLSHAGGGNLVTNVTFTVSDSAGFPFDPSFPIWSEVFRPTNYATSDFFPAPAPAGPYAPVAFSSFNGLAANGAWSLYVYDDVTPDHGVIAGWSLMVTTGTAPPTISTIADQSILVSTSTSAIPFTVGDPDTPVGNLAVSGSSSNTTLIPNGNIVFGGSGANRTVTVTPVANQTGSVTITVNVNDGISTTSTSFVVTVNPPFVGTRSFANAAAITIPDSGAGTPYPSVVIMLQWGASAGDNDSLMNSRFAVICGLTYNFLPFMILPLYASLERLDHSLIEAAGDLYATPIQTFWKVTWPLSLPGVVGGTLLTFIPAAGDFINSRLLGNTQTVMIGQVIDSEFLRVQDYSTAAALSFALMLLIVVIVAVYVRRAGTEELL